VKIWNRANLPEWFSPAKSHLETTENPTPPNLGENPVPDPPVAEIPSRWRVVLESTQAVTRQLQDLGRRIIPDAEWISAINENTRATTQGIVHEASNLGRKLASTSRVAARKAVSATRQALESLEERLGDEDDAPPPPPTGDNHLELARDSLRDLLNDEHVPPAVRSSLEEDYRQVQEFLEKIEHGHVYIAAFGRVSVGKSALLNALLGENRFRTSPLHGETRTHDRAAWEETQSGGVFLIDTPGVNEVEGESRERLAYEVASRADLVLFVVDGDITETELSALRLISSQGPPLILVLNKADRYTEAEQELLMATLLDRTQGLVRPGCLVRTAAAPSERIYVQLDDLGREVEIRRRPVPDVNTLREKLWVLLESEGKTLAALNASLFAGRLSDQVAARILDAKRSLAEQVVRTYCISKGIAVALNPIPVVDLLAAMMVDVSMVLHLSTIYGFSVTKGEASELIKTIATQTAVLMGTVWTVNLLSAALKSTTFGLSTILTAATQGAVAYYATYIVGQAAERFFAQGRSWGIGGPKQVVSEILAGLDPDSLIAQARADILARLNVN